MSTDKSYQTKQEFAQAFEAQLLMRYNSLFTPSVNSVKELVQAYTKMNNKDRTALFSKKHNGKLVHDFDQLIGKKPYHHISFSKKHFVEVTMPQYQFEPWP